MDEDSARGQFLLNGFSGLPDRADRLRVPRWTRWRSWSCGPSRQGEIHQTPDGFLEAAFTDPDRLLEAALPPLGLAGYLDRVCTGGLPRGDRHGAAGPSGVVPRTMCGPSPNATSKISPVLAGTRDLPRLLRLLAARTAGELVVEGLHDDAGFGSRHTTEAYLGYLQMTYLLLLLPAWSAQPHQQGCPTPENPHHRQRSRSAPPRQEPTVAGASHRPGPRPTRRVLRRERNCTARPPGRRDSVALHHFRDRGGREIDVVAESADGRLAAIEVKSGPVVDATDARHLRWLRDRVPDDFVCGVVLHSGGRAFRLGDRLLAVPISCLWTTERPAESSTTG